MKIVSSADPRNIRFSVHVCGHCDSVIEIDVLEDFPQQEVEMLMRTDSYREVEDLFYSTVKNGLPYELHTILTLVCPNCSGNLIKYWQIKDLVELREEILEAGWKPTTPHD